MTELVTSTIIAIVGVFSTAAGSIITWRIAKRKNNAEAKAAELLNVEKDISIYQTLVNDLTERLEKAVTAIKDRDETIERLIEANKERDKQIDHLIDEVEKLTDELRKYKQLNGKNN